MLWAFHNLRAWAHLSVGEFEECASWADKATHQPNCQVWPYAHLAAAYHHLGNTDAAEQAKETLFKIKPGFSLKFVKQVVGFSDDDGHQAVFDAYAAAGIPKT